MPGAVAGFGGGGVTGRAAEADATAVPRGEGFGLVAGVVLAWAGFAGTGGAALGAALGTGPGAAVAAAVSDGQGEAAPATSGCPGPD